MDEDDKRRTDRIVYRLRTDEVLRLSGRSKNSAPSSGHSRPGQGQELHFKESTNSLKTFRHWNYRVLEFNEDEETWRDIRIVFYDDDGKPVKYSDDPAAISTEDLSTNGLKAELWAFNAALLKPILKVEDFPEFNSSYSTEGDAK